MVQDNKVYYCNLTLFKIERWPRKKNQIININNSATSGTYFKLPIVTFKHKFIYTLAFIQVCQNS